MSSEQRSKQILVILMLAFLLVAEIGVAVGAFLYGNTFSAIMAVLRVGSILCCLAVMLSFE